METRKLYQSLSFWTALVLAGLIAGLLLFSPKAFGGKVETCARYQGVTVGNYIVQTDYWNQDKCPGAQCLSVDDQTGSYTVTKGTFDCGYSVASYPSILYGSAFGSVSPNSDLPAQVSSLKCVNSSWSFQPTNTGAWDAAYDIWFCPDNTCGPSGFKGGLELMIWIDYRNTNGWKNDLGPVTIDGMDWEVWQFMDEAGDHHQYVAYLPNPPMTSVENLDLKPFFDDSQARGYLKPSWYLYAVEVGNEMKKDGVPFTSKSFSVSVNKDCGVKPIFTALPTFTPTATPDTSPLVIPPPP